MSEYVNHKKRKDLSKIKVGSFSSDNPENWNIFFPIRMIKELIYLGFENKNNTLQTIEKNYEKIPKDFYTNRTYIQLNFTRKISDSIKEDLAARFEVIILPKGDQITYITPTYYFSELEKYLKDNKICCHIVAYKYQFCNKS